MTVDLSSGFEECWEVGDDWKRHFGNYDEIIPPNALPEEDEMGAKKRHAEFVRKVGDSYQEYRAILEERSASSRHSASERFHEILNGLGDLHDSKQKDYGTTDDPFANVRASSDWGIPGWVGAMVRASDKVKRLQSFVLNGSLANEGVEDSLRDLAVYAVIALVLFEEERSAAPFGVA